MNQNTSTTTDLTLKTKEVIGRDKEIKRLNQYIQARGDNNFVYYWADGGLGKTRLLEELQKMVKAAGPDFHFSGIIDLYHTDTHSTSDVERTIVDGLDPDKKYFAQYRQERDLFEKLRERGAYPTVLEQRRKKLSRLFIDDFRVMAKDVRKLVICFDTVELLQYESSIVEERAGLDKIDTRLKPWLLNNLKELWNVLVVFAGRPQKQPPGEITDLQKRFVNSLYEAFENNLTVVELPPFSLNETKLLIDELSNGVHLVPDDYLPIIHRLTRGRPIFIHLLVDLIMFLALEPGEVFKMFDEYKHLVDAPDDDKALTDAIERIEEKILHALFYETGDKGEYLLNIALMPKGVEPDILYTAIGMPRDQAQALLSELEYLSFTKKYTAPAGSEKLHGDRLFLHDEMYRLLKKSNLHIVSEFTRRK